MNQLDEYTEAAVQRLLTEHPDLGEQGITLTRREHCLVLSGEVESEQRREQIEQLVHQSLPDVELCCDIGLIRAAAPTEHEVLP
jgi:BON domain-containing protein